MSEPPPTPIVVEDLTRRLLDGVPNAQGELRRADLGLLPVFVDERPLLGLSGLVDWRTSGALTAMLRSGMCTGEYGERLLMPGRRTLPVDRILIYGLGLSSEFDATRADAVGQRIVGIARDLDARDVVFAVPSALAKRDASEALFSAVAHGLSSSPPVAAFAPPARDPVEPPAPIAGPAAEEAPEPRPQAPQGTVSGLMRAEPVSPPEPARWLVVADARLVQRLRRLLSGPPRAAGAG